MACAGGEDWKEGKRRTILAMAEKSPDTRMIHSIFQLQIPSLFFLLDLKSNRSSMIDGSKDWRSADALFMSARAL